MQPADQCQFCENIFSQTLSMDIQVELRVSSIEIVNIIFLLVYKITRFIEIFSVYKFLDKLFRTFINILVIQAKLRICIDEILSQVFWITHSNLRVIFKIINSLDFEEYFFGDWQYIRFILIQVLFDIFRI